MLNWNAEMFDVAIPSGDVATTTSSLSCLRLTSSCRNWLWIFISQNMCLQCLSCHSKISDVCQYVGLSLVIICHPLWTLNTCICRNNQDALDRNVHELPRVDLYGAGPPCQPVSSAGRKRGLVCRIKHQHVFIFWQPKLKSKTKGGQKINILTVCAIPNLIKITQGWSTGILLQCIISLHQGQKTPSSAHWTGTRYCEKQKAEEDFVFQMDEHVSCILLFSKLFGLSFDKCH